MAELPHILQDDKNFILEKLDWQGKPAVKKSAKESTPETRKVRLKNDVYGMQFFTELAKTHSELNLYAPVVYESGDDYYIREFIDDSPVVNENMGLEEAAGRLDKLAQLLAGIDRLEPFGMVRFIGSSNYHNLHKSIYEWTDENIRDDLITPGHAARIKEISASLGTYIKPRIAHGDMSLYRHAYQRPDGKIALIDCENFTPEAARYFDVAWGYTRLYSFSSTTDIPKHFLSSFLAQAEKPEHQTEQLMAVLIQRTLGMQKDAEGDAKKGTEYRERAAELLELVLQNKLGLLCA